MKYSTSLTQTAPPSFKCRTANRYYLFFAACVVSFAAWRSFGASQIWTNTPVDATWVNTNNWVARAIPGAVNLTGNSVNNDIATFNSPTASGIGSAANPIVTDTATTINTTAPRCRQIGGITFDTANCGAYVFTNPSAINVTDTNFVFSGVLYISHNGSIQLTSTVTNRQ